MTIRMVEIMRKQALIDALSNALSLKFVHYTLNSLKKSPGFVYIKFFVHNPTQI